MPIAIIFYTCIPVYLSSKRLAMSSDLSKIKLSFNVKDLKATTLSGQATLKHIRNNVRQKKRIDVCYTCSRSLIMHSPRSLRFSFQGTQQKHSTAEKCAKLASCRGSLLVNCRVSISCLKTSLIVLNLVMYDFLPHVCFSKMSCCCASLVSRSSRQNKRKQFITSDSSIWIVIKVHGVKILGVNTDVN